MSTYGQTPKKLFPYPHPRSYLPKSENCNLVSNRFAIILEPIINSENNTGLIHSNRRYLIQSGVSDGDDL